MDALVALLALLLHWRAALIVIVAFGSGIAMSLAFPSLGAHLVVGFTVLGVALGIAFEARHVAKHVPQPSQPPETTSSRLIALLGFAIIGAGLGWLFATSITAVLVSAFYFLGIPALALAFASRQASNSRRSLLSAAFLAALLAWLGFAFAVLAKFTLGGPNAA